VPSTRETVAVGVGDLGKRAFDARDDEVVRESEDVVRDPIASPARMTVESTVDGETANVPCAHPDRRSREHATTPPG